MPMTIPPPATTPEPKGSLETAIGNLQRLLAVNPALAAEQAREILAVFPKQPDAWLALGVAQRLSRDLDASRDTLAAFLAETPRDARGHYELGRTLTRGADGEGAIAAFRRAVALSPDHGDAWRALGDELAAIDDMEGAHAAYAQHLRASAGNPELVEAALALCDNDLARTETLLRAYLKRRPTDVAAIRMLAELAARLGRYLDSENLLRRALDLAPSFAAARYNLAIVLYRQQKSEAALEAIEALLAEDADDSRYLLLKAAALTRLGAYDDAIAHYERLLHCNPNQSKTWMSYGHALKTVGRIDDSVAAYRKSAAIAPNFGEAYWSLANLKTYRFPPGEIEAMRAALSKELGAEDRLHFHFALGKALEDSGDWAAAFEHYSEGNRLRRGMLDYDADENTLHIKRAKALFTEPFFAARKGAGADAPDPIFIVGLPRAGSTLIEQILASHSQVEGTMELPDIIAMARRIGAGSDGVGYPEALAALSRDELRALGEEYVERTRGQRKTDRPYFIDKMPNNFAHIGFVHLILPNAKIIDARRHPMANCFSAFKQHFARGQGFSYSLEDLGKYYRDYAGLIDHFDAVLPGLVHLIRYERMVADTEGEVRRLLAHCGLAFEPKCLQFHETERAVRTASSEQVRRPISSESVDAWRHFEPWLGSLREALGPELANSPEL